MLDFLERPVDREHHAVGAHLKNGLDQRLGAEISRRRHMEVGARNSRRSSSWPGCRRSSARRHCSCRPARGRTAGLRPCGRARSTAAGIRRTGPSPSAARHAPRSRCRTPRPRPSATDGRHRGARRAPAGCADADRTARRAARPRPRTAGIAAGRSRPTLSGSPTCEKPLTSAPLKPSSLTQRCELLDRSVRVLHRQRGERLEPVRPLAHFFRKIVVGPARQRRSLLPDRAPPAPPAH